MAFQTNIVTDTGRSEASNDSTLQLKSGAASGNIRSSSFLSGGGLKPGQQQVLVRGGDKVVGVKGDAGLIVMKDWARTIGGRESVVCQDYKREYDDTVNQWIYPDGELQATYNGSYRRFYLDGSKQIRNANDNITIGHQGEAVQLRLNQYGDQVVSLRIKGGTDTKTVHGDAYTLQEGDTSSVTHYNALSFCAGANLHSYVLHGAFGSSSGAVQQEFASTSGQLGGELNAALGRLANGYDSSDRSKLPKWGDPSSSVHPPIRVFLSAGINIAFKRTLELTFAIMRNAFTVIGSSVRADHAFIVGLAGNASLAEIRGLVAHQLSAILDIRAWLFGMGLPRVPTAPPAVKNAMGEVSAAMNAFKAERAAAKAATVVEGAAAAGEGAAAVSEGAAAGEGAAAATGEGAASAAGEGSAAASGEGAAAGEGSTPAGWSNYIQKGVNGANKVVDKGVEGANKVIDKAIEGVKKILDD